jgi:hypothetical protein
MIFSDDVFSPVTLHKQWDGSNSTRQNFAKLRILASWHGAAFWRGCHELHYKEIVNRKCIITNIFFEPKKVNDVQLNAVEGNFPWQRTQPAAVCSLRTALRQHNLSRLKVNLCFLQITFSYSPVMPQWVEFYSLTQLCSFWKTRKRLHVISDVTDHQTR